jgi:hypothetical protein
VTGDSKEWPVVVQANWSDFDERSRDLSWLLCFLGTDNKCIAEIMLSDAFDQFRLVE